MGLVPPSLWNRPPERNDFKMCGFFRLVLIYLFFRIGKGDISRDDWVQQVILFGLRFLVQIPRVVVRGAVGQRSPFPFGLTRDLSTSGRRAGSNRSAPSLGDVPAGPEEGPPEPTPGTTRRPRGSSQIAALLSYSR